MRLYIKNMVCNRCIAAVKQILEEEQLAYSGVQLGEVETETDVPANKLERLRDRLAQAGFELLDDARKQLIERIKTLIIEQVHYGKGDERFNLSHNLSTRLQKDYSYLSHLFSQVEGMTIEKYFISQKIERAKELLAYNQNSLSEIAFELGYSSVAHLSSQFRKLTGLTPSHFKKLGAAHRKPLDGI